MNNESTDSKQPEIVPNLVRRENSPGAISDNTGTIAQGGSATINDRTALYIAILALVISALCLGLFLMQTFLMPQLIDAKVQAGAAKAEEMARLASTKAQLVERDQTILREALQRKGIIIPPKD